MSRFPFFLTLMLLLPVFGWAQSSPQTDSLYLRLAQQPRDSHTVKAMIRLAEKHSWSIPDSGLYYAQQAIEENKRQNGPARFTAYAWNAVGYSTYMKGQYPKAMEAFQQYFQFAKKSRR